MHWLFHFAEFSLSKHFLLEARQRCRDFSLLSAYRDDGKRFAVRADDKLPAFLELESTIRLDLIPKLDSVGSLRRLLNAEKNWWDSLG